MLELNRFAGGIRDGSEIARSIECHGGPLTERTDDGGQLSRCIAKQLGDVAIDVGDADEQPRRVISELQDRPTGQPISSAEVSTVGVELVHLRPILTRNFEWLVLIAGV